MNWAEIEKQVSENFPKEKYKAFCEQIVDLEMSIAYLKTAQGREAIGSEKALEKIKENESLIRRIKAQKQHIINYLNAIRGV